MDSETESDANSPAAIVVSAGDTAQIVKSMTEDNVEHVAPWTDKSLRISINTHPYKGHRDSVVSEDLGMSPLSSEATIFDVETPNVPKWK